MHKTTYQNIVTAIGSPKVFWGLIGFLVFEAVWIALTGRYSMAFDENFHLGIIQIYAEQWSPFLSEQPAHADAYGAVFRDPSYLYHYLMSFPYRLTTLFTENQAIQVIILRLLNIAFFVASIAVYRKVLQTTGASRTLINVVLACFVLIPVVPLLAAQINYDNMLMLLVAGALLLAVRFVQELKTSGQINVVLGSELLVVSLLASLVQYKFLPIFGAIVLFVSWSLFRELHGSRDLLHAAYRGYRLLRPRTRWILWLILAVSMLLFAERYVLNTIKYKTPLPDCSQVLTTEQCMAYGPWARNYIYTQDKPDAASSSIVSFTDKWVEGMWLRSFFAVDGPRTDFQTRGPLPVPSITAVVVASIGTVLLVFYGRRIFKQYNSTALALLGFVMVCYVGVLYLNNYQGYIQTGQPVAINGRYLVPVFLPLMLVLGLGYSKLFRRWLALKIAASIVVILCLLWGGGFLTYVLRSNPAWYWPNKTVYEVNGAVQRVLSPLVPGTQEPTMFLD